MGSLGNQLFWLLLLAIPVACVAWTITHEEVFREPRDFCKTQSESAPSFVRRKFFYLFTCEYCFSHYVAAFFLWLTRYHLLLEGWRGYLIAWFSLVFVSNLYMGAFGIVKLGVKKERVEIQHIETDVQHKQTQLAEAREERRPAA
ncbi:hypothetical protein Acid345_4464 [Candidatus Koribacter versatilis Ellin345]|uniref:DUF1360 domain-containing protein n=1 Tax=Koribacter versatilis (strain Ellin345) TaxID=204669 RepID=Q1II36_KORVE|nr:hypothetical protein [Candidatus Koribacter versatilis]ABF43464.1 hypothetical protein Acid345_4464 [Candidatus Koribacter versatilis Ellin345]